MHTSETHHIPKTWRSMLRTELKNCVSLTVGGDFADIRDPTGIAGANVVVGLGAIAPSSGYAEDNDNVDVLLLDPEETFDAEQVRIAFWQFFIRICRNYRSFMEY